MRICLYTETALPKLGGQEVVVDALARQFVTLGHEPVVLAPYPRRPLRADDAGLPYRVVRHPRFFSTHWFVSWYRWFLLRLFRRQHFDVLHCHGLYPPGYLAALCRARLNVPMVITSHGGDVAEGNRRLARLHDRFAQGLAAADALVAISRFTRAGFQRLCPQARRIVDIPNGVDLEALSRPASRPAHLDASIKPGGYALFVGRLKPRKGVDVLLEALAHLPANGEVQLVIAGDGEDRPRLEALARQLGVAGRVRFVGQRTGAEKTYLLQNALFSVVPSRVSEAFGLVVVESYAAGLPVVASRLAGLADLVEPKRTGYLVAPEAPGELAAAMQRLYSQPARRWAMGTRARQIAQGLDWRAVALRHLELYEELLTDRAMPEFRGTPESTHMPRPAAETASAEA